MYLYWLSGFNIKLSGITDSKTICSALDDVVFLLHNIKLNKDHPAFITSVADFVELHALPIDGIFFTNGMLKFKKLIELESIRHHDDNPSEVEAIKQYAPHIEVVVV